MTDHALIVPTSAGPVGAIVSEPDDAPRASAILLQGGGPPCRAGVNGHWARLARALADSGIVVLRFDFVAEGDSTVVGEGVAHEPGWRQEVNLKILGEVAPWLAARTGIQRPVLAGSCHGARVALEFAAGGGEAGDVLLVVPYLWSVPPNMRPDKEAQRQKSLPRASEIFDHGSSDLETQRQGNGAIEAVDDETPLSEQMVDRCRAALDGRRIWMLIGEGDSQKPVELKRRLGGDGERLEVDVVAGTIIHPITHPEIQSLVSERLMERVSGAVGGGAIGPGRAAASGRSSAVPAS